MRAERFFHDFLSPGCESSGVRGRRFLRRAVDRMDENAGFMVEGRPSSPDDETHAQVSLRHSRLFSAIGIPCWPGVPSANGRSEAPCVIVINVSMARRYWPGQNAIGKRITFSDHPKEKDWLR